MGLRTHCHHNLSLPQHSVSFWAAVEQACARRQNSAAYRTGAGRTWGQGCACTWQPGTAPGGAPKASRPALIARYFGVFLISHARQCSATPGSNLPEHWGQVDGERTARSDSGNSGGSRGGGGSRVGYSRRPVCSSLHGRSGSARQFTGTAGGGLRQRALPALTCCAVGPAPGAMGALDSSLQPRPKQKPGCSGAAGYGGLQGLGLDRSRS